MKTTILVALAVLGAVLSGRSATAQCAFPDGLSGPCCTTAQANLPSFPSLQLPGMGICWTACDPTQQPCVNVSLGVPLQTACAQYTVNMTATDCLTGLPLLTGSLVLDYTRNWDEAGGPIGGLYGVWRFAVKADLSGTAGIAPGCPVPSCLAAHPTAFYYGYLDYALDCVTGNWEGALVLYHACDKFIHDPLISDRPGVFHPTTSYALVAPATAANPFIPAVTPAPGGPIVAEAVRQAASLTSLACTTEEPVQGQIQPLGEACACPFAFLPPQVTARLMTAAGACGSSFASVNLFPTFPWLHVMTTSIGTWTTGASYPGPEIAWVDEGPILYTDGCVPAVFGEVHYGGSTSKGFDVLHSPIGPALTQNFTDLASNYSIPLPGPIALPIVGSVQKTRHLIYVNVP